MAGKKGRMHQVLFAMVDATDFATIESGVVAASCTAKFYGVNHGGSTAMTSGTVSKALSLVRSGILRATLKTTENNYDHMMLKITESDTGCANQILSWENETVSNSDVHSLLSASDLYSDIAAEVWRADPSAISAANTIGSLLCHELDGTSALHAGNSDILSDIKVLVTSGATSAAVAAIPTADLSDALSQVLVDTGTTIPALLQSVASDIWAYDKDSCTTSSSIGSALQAAAGLNASQVWAYDASTMSGIAGSVGSLLAKEIDGVSAMLAGMSDTLSAVAVNAASGATSAAVATIPTDNTKASVVSAVWAANPSLISGASTIGSLLTHELDGLSALVKGNSDALSSVIATQGAHTTSIEDTASKVWSVNPSTISGASTLGSLVVKSLDDGVLVGTTSKDDLASAVWAKDKDSAVVSSSVGSVLQAAGGATPSGIWAYGKASAADAGSIGSALQAATGATPSSIWAYDKDSAAVSSSIGSALQAATGATPSAIWAYDASTMSAVAGSIGSLLSHELDGLSALGAGNSDILSDIKVLAASGATSAAVAAIPTDNTKASVVSAVWAANPSTLSAVSTIGSLLMHELDGLSGVHTAQTNYLIGASDILSDIKILTTSGATSAAVAGIPTDNAKDDVASAVWAKDKDSAVASSSIGSALQASTGASPSSIWAYDKDSAVVSSSIGSVLQASTGATPSAIWAYDASTMSGVAGSVGSLLAKEVDGLSAMLAGNSDILSDIKVLVTSGATSAAVAAIPTDSLSNALSQVLVDTGTTIPNTLASVASNVWAQDPSALSAASTIGSLLIHELNGLSVLGAGNSDVLSDIKVLATSGATSAAVAAIPTDNTKASVVSAVWAANPSSIGGASTIGSLLTHELDGLSALGAGNSDILSDLKVLATSGATSAAVAAIPTANLSNALSQVLVDTETSIPALIQSVASDVWAYDKDSCTTSSSIGSALQASAGLNASQVWAYDASTMSGVAGSVGSLLAHEIDGLSATGAGLSNIQSGMSDILSDVKVLAAGISNIQSGMSDTLSDVKADTGNIYSLLSDTDSRFASRVNAEMADIIKTDTIAQLSAGAPPAAPTFEEAVMYLYQYFRNKRTQSTSRIVMYGDDESTSLCRAAITDAASVFTKGEFSAVS